MKKNILLSFLFIFLFFETADSRHSLIVNGLSGAPLFEFDIADSAGEYYALGQNPQGAEFFWNLVPQHNKAIQNAAFYWANLLGNSPSNSSPVKISIGLFNYLNDSAIADYGANGSGRTTLVNAIYGNTADSLIDPAGNPSYNDTAFAQIQIGVLCFPWLDYMGQSIEELGYVWNDTSGWSFEDMRLLPNNGLTDGMVSVLVHELGHAMGIMSFEYYKYGGNDLYFQEYDGVNLNKFDFYLYDSFGNRAQANQKVRLSDFIDYTASDFRIIRQGDSSLSDSEQSGFAFFQGPETLAVLDGAIHSVNNPNNVVGLPIRGFEGENSDLSHLELRNSMMSHQNWRNWNTFMEAELALLQDIGIPIDRKNFFGRSIYKDNANISVSDNFYKRNDAGTAYLSGQYNLTPWTIGLHIYGTNNTVSMNGEVLQSGDASAGIRIDGWNNKLSIGSSAKIYSNGRDNSALLVSYGKEHNIILRGQLTSMGAGGIGARFDFGDNVLGDMYEYRGSYMRRRASFDPDASVNPYWNPFSWDMDALLPELEGALVSKFDITGTLKGGKAALYIARNAFVKEINVMRGAELEGAIISDWSPTFNFSAVDDIFNYVQYYSGYIIIGGNVYLTPGNLEDLKTKLTFGYLPNTSGEKTNSADSAFNLTYNGDISAKGYIDIEIAGGNLNYGGTIKGVSKILKSSLGNFTMRGDGSKFDGIFEQTAGNTEIALTGKMFGGQNYIYDSVLTVNSSNTGYNLNVGSNAQLRHYNTNAASPANIGSNIKFTGDAVGAKISFDSFDPSQYRVAYALDNQIDNGLPNAVSFKNAEIKFSISDFKNSSGRTKYIFENSILDLRQVSISTPAAPRNFLFPSIEVAASSLSMSVFYSSGAFSADTLSANSAQGKLFLSDISFFGNAQRGDEGFVKVFSGGLQFEENAIAEKSIGKYVYSVESSSWSGSYFDLGYYYLNVRVSMLDFLFRSNAQSGVRIFDFSVSDIKEYGAPYYISRSLDGMANGKFTIKGDEGFLRDSPQNSISGFIIDGAGQKGSLFKISGASAFLEMENINISDAAGENGSALNIENARSTAAFLKNVLMKNNSAQQGGAVYIYKSAAIMEDISFIGNSASQKGGAIYIGGELGASAFLTLRAFKEDIVFHSNKVLSKDNDMRLEKYSRLILDADGADIKMDGSIDGGAVENYILKTGAKTLTLGGNTDFGGTFEIVSGKLVFDKNSFVRISTLSVGGSSILPFASKSAAKAVSAETEVLTSSLTISNLTINADGKFSMSDIVSRHITYLDNVKIAGILEIGFDLSGENGIADRFYAGSINIIDGAQLIVKGYGIGTSSDVVFKGSLTGSMWNRGGISGAVSAGEYEIFYEPSEGAYFIKTMVSQNFSALEGLSDNQKNVSDFLSSVPNSDVAVQKIINPLTKMQDAVNINKGLNQLIGLIYADVLSAGTRGGIYEIIYSNIKTPAYVEKAAERTEYKKKEKNRYQLFDDKELEKLGILASIDIDESAVAQSNKDKKTDKTSLEAKADKNLWFNIGGSDGFLRSKESGLELKNRSISFAAGSDIFNTRIKSAGLFISYEAQNAETDLEKADIADIRFGSYFSFTPSNNLSIKADLGFGIEGFDIERIVDYGANYGGETLKAQSQFYGYSLAGGLEAQIASFAKGRIKPFLDLRLGFSATPEVIEENAKYANLTIDPAYHLMAKPSAGLKSAFSIGEALISLKVALSYLAAGEKEAQIYFKELKDFGGFSVKGIEEEKISGSAGAGFQYNFGKDAALSLNANALFSDNSILYSFFGGFSFAW